MAERVGGIYYDVTLDTSKMIDGQRKVDASLRETGASLDGFGARLSKVATAVAIYAAAMAALKTAELADDMRLLAARVNVAAGSMDAGSVAMSALVDISRRTQTAVEANVDVFTRLNASIMAMGGTQADTLRITELLGMAIKVSGASAIEAKNAMLQFGQALGSGKLQGDELRSLMETAPYLMKQLADGLGVPIGALKNLGTEGKLTADVVTNALGKAATQIESDFASFPQTVGGALQVAYDAALRANEKFDELTGTSTILAGASKGLGEVLDKLAGQFGAANEQAGELGRNEAIKGWADRSKVAFSYLIDAADLLWQTISVLGRNVAFVFEGIGTEIGGIGAQVAAVLRGDFAQAKSIGDMMEADADERRRKLDDADAKALGRAKLAGQEMRDAWEQGAGGGRGNIIPGAAPSKLTPPAGTPEKTKKRKRQETDYIGQAEQDAADRMEAWRARNEETMDRNEQASARARAEAKILLTTSAEERILLIRQESERLAAEAYSNGAITFEEAETEKIRAAQDAAEQLRNLQANRASTALDTLSLNAGSGGLEAQIALIQAEATARLAANAEAARLDIEQQQLYADQKVAIEADMNRRIADLRVSANQAALMSTSDAFGSLVTVLQNAGKEQTGVFKAVFLAQKAFSIASSIVAIQTGIANASALPFPANLGAMASVVAATASIISTIQGANYGGGRQYGGPVSAGSLYKVNETGAPEMYTGSNGSQYMLPNRSGSVTPASELGGGGVQWNVVIQNAPAGTTASVDQSSRTVEIAVATVAEQISSNSGQVWSALRGSTNVGPKM